MESSIAGPGTGGPPNWIRFDEISMTPPIGGFSSSGGQHKPSPGSDKISNERSHLVKEGQFELENIGKDVVTSLPTKEVIAGNESVLCYDYFYSSFFLAF
uniref:Uncharacterized protein n=1 Tax=Angiostrongylus cantonensis TaxID=6313 RepID=A0A0K0D8D5_ANGCA